MFTLCLRYTLDPNKLPDFRAYVTGELGPIRRSGCICAVYYYPTDFAGPTNEALGLIDFTSLDAYETYRSVLGSDSEHEVNVAALQKSGAVLVTHRSFIERADAG